MKEARAFLLVCLTMLVLGCISVAVHGHTGPALSVNQSQQEMSVQGELLKVDTTSMTFTIKPEEGEEISFQYDSNTKVEGSQEGVQALNPESGMKVIVHYGEQSGKKVAIRIEVVKTDG